MVSLKKLSKEIQNVKQDAGQTGETPEQIKDREIRSMKRYIKDSVIAYHKNLFNEQDNKKVLSDKESELDRLERELSIKSIESLFYSKNPKHLLKQNNVWTDNQTLEQQEIDQEFVDLALLNKELDIDNLSARVSSKRDALEQIKEGVNDAHSRVVKQNDRIINGDKETKPIKDVLTELCSKGVTREQFLEWLDIELQIDREEGRLSKKVYEDVLKSPLLGD